jgi:uncharacterized membrane protein
MDRQSLGELTKRNIETINHLEQATQENGLVHKAADSVTRFSGSLGFLILNLAFYGGWIALNTTLTHPFDPFPFSLLTLFLSVEAILLSIFILMSERQQTLRDEQRSKLDLQVNLLTEQENTKMLQLLVALAHKHGIDVHDDKMLDALTKTVRPEELAKQMEQAQK